MTLNEEQLTAVGHPIGRPACLIAGAGSGKTTTLTERVRWLIQQGVPPLRIGVVTFTNKAAGTLASRLGLADDASPESRPHISTIHSLALNAIRKDPEGFGFDGRVTPMDDYDQGQAMKKLIERTPPVRGVDMNAWRVLEKIGYHRARGVGFAADYTKEVDDEAQERHGGYHAMDDWEVGLWGQFEEMKKAANLVDFDDMVILVVRRGEGDASWRAALQRRFHHVLQDESQDTSPVQWRLINLLLADDNPNLYCVGDISQSIYGFQGAEPKLLREFSEGWRGLVPDLYRISRNHRSLPSIIRLGNKINATMTETIPLRMALFRGLDDVGTEVLSGSTRLIRAATPKDIAFTIAQEIRRDSQAVPYRENAILVRSAIQVRDIEGELVRLRIPYVVRGGKGLLQTEEAKDVLAYFRLAVNPRDFTAFARAVGAPKRGVGDVSLERLRKAAGALYGGDLVEACGEEDRLLSFHDGMRQAMAELADPAAALEAIVRLFGYKDHISRKYFREAGKAKAKAENVDRFLALVATLCEDGLSAEDLVFQLTRDRATEEEREGEDDGGEVVISTIHSAKGLEWRRVYVTNVTEGSLPHRFSMSLLSEIEEERRLFYVACTRAKDALAICIHEVEQYGPGTRTVAPSRFLAEIGVA